MGTNFYARRRGNHIKIHVGKLSAGWEFVFQKHSDPPLDTFARWRKFLKSNDVTVQDDGGDIYQYSNFFRSVVLPTRGRTNHVDAVRDPNAYKDPDGWAFIDAEFS